MLCVLRGISSHGRTKEREKGLKPQSTFTKELRGPDRTAPDRLLSGLRLILLALVLVIVAYVRIRLLNVPLERDEGEYAYLGQLMLKGFPPFLHVYTMKLPGVGMAYALIMFLFGETARGIHLGLLLVNAANALLVYLLARRLLGRDAAAISCATYAILSLSQSVLGVFAHATHFVVLFSLSALIALLRWRDNGRGALLLASGILLGLAVLMKQHAAILIVFACIYLARNAWKRGIMPAGSRLAAYSLFLLGACLPYALIASWMAAAGTFGTFWFWTVSYAGEYASKLTFSNGLKLFNHSFCFVALGPQWLLWLLGAIGGVMLCTSQGRRADRTFLGGLTLFSFLAICPGLYFRYHYFVMLLPAVALLAGFAVAASEHAISMARPGKALRFIPFCLFMAAAGFGLYQEKEYLFLDSPFEVSRSVYGVNPFPESLQIARYLREHTSAQDTIAVIGSEPQIYFYAGRPAATSYIYMYGLMEKQPFAVSMQKEMIRQIERTRPKYIVMVNTPASWLESEDSSEFIFHWAAGYLDVEYDPVGVIDILTLTKTVYLWDSQVVGYRPESVSSVVVYKRNAK
jgi:4-amino-4-deoxy-L-arabinose transferase-like glycosyltransferase